jgi:PAS domain-containing protein
MCVRRFTPAITSEINLIEQDIGRPIGHISHNLKNEDLIMETKEVMFSLIPVEKEVQSKSNKWYILKYSPYRTNENIIKGVVISLVDITARKKAEESQRKIKERYENLVELSPFAVFIVKDNLIQFSNSEGLRLLQIKSLVYIIGKPISNYLDMNGSVLINDKKDSLTKYTKDTISHEEKLIRGDGSEIYAEIVSMPISFAIQLGITASQSSLVTCSRSLNTMLLINSLERPM